MKCPNCNIETEKGVCLKCGYMENGNIIEQFKDTNQHTEIRLYNEDFDEMNTNQNKLLNFIMGSYYFSYRGHLLAGLISSTIAILIFIFEIKLTSAFESLGSISTLLIFLNTTFYIIINRTLYMSFSTVICIQLDKYHIKKIKDINKIVKHKSKNIIYLIIHLIITIITIIILN